MGLLQAWIESGRIVDLMIAVIVLEIAVVAAYRRRSGGGIPLAALLVNVGAGGSLMLALRASLGNAGWQWIALFLITALVCHVADLRLRWQPASR